MYRNRFKKFGGDKIPDVIEYLKDFLDKDPSATITVGCDSIQKRRKTVYANTIMLYNSDVRNGATVLYFMESFSKIRDNSERLYREAKFLHDVGTYLDGELSGTYVRRDLMDCEIKRYKYHLLKCDGSYSYVQSHQDDSVMNNLVISDEDRLVPRLVDLHIDYNPFKGSINAKGNHKNKSYDSYKSYVPWLRGMGFRTWAKPLSFAATSAADLLLKEDRK